MEAISTRRILKKRGAVRVIKKVIITGCAGFIGSTLTDRMLDLEYDVIGIDNFSTGKIEFLENASTKKNFTLVKADLLYEKDILADVFKGCDSVFHLAANADIKNNIFEPQKNIEQNILATFNVLEATVKAGAKNIIFSSTGSVYGETPIVPTPESAALYPQTSIYAATKVASEALIEAYCESFGINGFIFRFVSVLGPRYHHGHVYDFYNKLKNDKNILEVLGNGKQTKSYLHVYDCVNAILLAIKLDREKVYTYNLGTDEVITVEESIKEITRILQVKPDIIYEEQLRGWIGDNPLIYLDCSKIKKLGWKPKYTIKKGIEDTLKYLIKKDEKNINNNRR